MSYLSNLPIICTIEYVAMPILLLEQMQIQIANIHQLSLFQQKHRKKKREKKEKHKKKEKKKKNKSEYEVAEGITTPSKEQVPTPVTPQLPVCMVDNIKMNSSASRHF
jgi:hypothetical protein